MSTRVLAGFWLSHNNAAVIRADVWPCVLSLCLLSYSPFTFCDCCLGLFPALVMLLVCDFSIYLGEYTVFTKGKNYKSSTRVVIGLSLVSHFPPFSSASVFSHFLLLKDQKPFITHGEQTWFLYKRVLERVVRLLLSKVSLPVNFTVRAHAWVRACVCSCHIPAQLKLIPPQRH